MYALLVQYFNGPTLIRNHLMRDTCYPGVAMFETYEEAKQEAKQLSFVDKDGTFVTFLPIIYDGEL